MKKYIFLFLLGIIMLSGCQAGGQQGKSNKQDDSQSFERRRPDFGQPEEEADVRGLVKSIVGNEVTILKLERPQNREQDGERAGFGALDDLSGNENEEGAQKTAFGSGVSGGRMPGMRGGMRSGTNDENDREQMLERMKSMSSGETSVVIPVGIQMLKPGTSTDGMPTEMIEASLEDIKADTMMQIWLDASVTGQSVAKFVLIMN